MEVGRIVYGYVGKILKLPIKKSEGKSNLYLYQLIEMKAELSRISKELKIIKSKLTLKIVPNVAAK